MLNKWNYAIKFKIATNQQVKSCQDNPNLEEKKIRNYIIIKEFN